ncbi:MAG: trypsin-like peptidase domain-containing protein [Treponema sp.]|jgi:S1-C subfamily serine protease|nr:trypsin-like peptidase domain-containing protein [Treponema sp.]
MKKNNRIKQFLIGSVIVLLSFSCTSTSTEKQEDDLMYPYRSTSSIRLGDIEKQITENPVGALHMIYIYKEVYSSKQNDDDGDWDNLLEYEKLAVNNLREMQEKAIKEEKWDDAISFSRSLASIGITVEKTGLEPDLVLADAKKKLADGNNLSAFLSAVKAHELKPLDSADALLFLERAVKVKQRRAAAFFLSAAQKAGSKNIASNLLEYARGRDTVSDMVNGVATVLIDRGIKVERGMGIPDRVLGSAFFVDDSGLLITNYHVIASEVDPKYKGYSRMYIRLGDSSSPRYPARVIGWDKALDLALIKTEYDPEYVFSLVDRVIPKVGDAVWAIGSPVGLEKTVTSGIVSALSRRFLQIGDVYQIDAAVNGGNSGGPVVDNEGRLVGIVFAGIDQHQGLNFAIPAERLSAALPAMIKGGKAQRPWLGITLCETLQGAEIVYVAPNTPAARHLIREGSYIKTINGKAVTAVQGSLIPAMQNAIFPAGPGELVVLETVDSEGVVKKNIVMTVRRPDVPLSEAVKVDKRERIAAPLFGMILTPVYGGLFSSNFVVRKVVRGSIADEAGISEDDPISIMRLRVMENDGYALMEISIKKRRMGYIETSMQLPAWLDSPDTL